VDYLRSCYATDCRFFADDPTPSRIQWYFCKEDAADLGFGTAFTSNVWLDLPEGDQDLGEVPGAEREWKSGLAPYPTSGDRPCGTAEQFAEGVPAPPVPPVPLNVFGGPECCPLPPPPFVHYSCRDFQGGSWNEYTVIVSGATGAWAPSNGIYSVTFRGAISGYPACNWIGTTTFDLPVFPLTGVTWGIQSITSFVDYVVTLYLGLRRWGFLYLIQPWDGLSAVFHAPLEGSSPIPGLSPFISLIPGPASVPGPFCPAQGAFLPSVLLIRTPAPVLGLGNTLAQQDAPFTATGPCRYQGTLWWDLPGRLRGLVRLQTTATITFGPGDLVTLSGRTPSFIVFSYTASLPAWDLSPSGLLLAASAGLLGGLPQAVTLYVQAHLPA